MEIKETSVNLVETIGHYEIYEGNRPNTIDAYFIIDNANESHRLPNEWTLENARDRVTRQLELEAWEYENIRDNRKYQSVKPSISDKYEVGALLVYSWGYDQTNIDYFCIVSVSKSGDYVTLLPVKTAAVVETGWLQGDCVASNTLEFEKKAFRRKLARTKKGETIGVAINSYGWCKLYDGGVDHWTAYH